MASSKLTDLTAATSLAVTDLVYAVINPGTTPASRKITIANLAASIKLDDLAAADDNTDLNATTGHHGLLPKLSGASTEFLNGLGLFATPAGGTQSNLLINGGFDIFQRQTPGTETPYADDKYCADRWNLLTQTASGSVSRVAGDTNSQYAIRIKQPQSTAQRIGLMQIVESPASIPLRNSPLVFSGKVKTSTAQTINYAILDMGSQAADTVVSDVVNDWTSPTYTAGNFFIASGSCNVLSSGSIASGSAFTQFTLAASSGSTLNNLAVMVWTAGSVAQNVTMDLTELGLYPGSIVPPWRPRSIQQELSLCQRYLFLLKMTAAWATISWAYVQSNGTGFYSLVNLPVPIRNPLSTTWASSAATNFFLGGGAYQILSFIGVCANHSSGNILQINGTAAASTPSTFRDICVGNTTTDWFSIESEI